MAAAPLVFLADPYSDFCFFVGLQNESLMGSLAPLYHTEARIKGCEEKNEVWKKSW